MGRYFAPPRWGAQFFGRCLGAGHCSVIWGIKKARNIFWILPVAKSYMEGSYKAVAFQFKI